MAEILVIAGSGWPRGAGEEEVCTTLMNTHSYHMNICWFIHIRL